MTALYRAKNFDIDNEGNIFILDAGNFRVLKFSSKGQFICEFGRKGKGPGEFISPNLIDVDVKNQVYVTQDNKMLLFDNNGIFLKDLTISPLNHFLISPLYVDFIGSDQIVMNIFDSSGLAAENPKEVLLKQYIVVHSKSSDKQVIISDIFKYPRMTAKEFFTNCVSDKNGNIFYATVDPQTYQVFMYKPTGELVKKISKQYNPVPLSSSKKKKLQENNEKFAKLGKAKMLGWNLTVPLYYNSINSILVDSQNFLWVFTNEGINDNKNSIDLFNDKGELIKSFFIMNKYLNKISGNKMKILKDYLYAIVKNEDEEEKFVRFSLPKEIWY